MRPDTIYEERIFSKWSIIVLATVTIALLFVLVYQLLVGPIGTRPAPNWVLLTMFLLFLAITVNFATLTIKVTPQHISVGYGIIKHVMAWENVADCYPDMASIVRYGGWGIRLGRVGGRWRLVYNVVGGPRVVLLLKEGKFKEFVFSTRDAEEVARVIKQRMGKMAV
jgi:hypothetical protein